MHCGCFCQILSENHVASTEALSYLHFTYVQINPRKLLLTTKIAILKQANHTASDWFWIHDFWFLCCCFLYSFLRGKTNPAQKDLLIRDQTMILTYFILKRFRGLFYHFFFSQNIDRFFCIFMLRVYRSLVHILKKINETLIWRHCKSNKSIQS